MSETVLDILNSGMMPPSLNLTHIVLIPKVKNPLSVTDFRLINLCNVLYKLFLKSLRIDLRKFYPALYPPHRVLLSLADS